MKKLKKQAEERQQEPVVNLNSLLTSEDVQRLLVERSRNAALAFGVDLLEQEAFSRCGAKYARKGEELCHRGGSEATSLILDGVKYPFRRPRIHDESGEVELETLKKLRDEDLFDQTIQTRMLRGITTRNYDSVVAAYATKTGISKSSVSRSFKRASQKSLDELNHADLKAYTFVGIMIDGVEFAGRAIVVALGITHDLTKVPLGIKEGNTENAEVVKDLLAGVIDRGFTMHCGRLLAVLDGAKALKKAVRDVFGDKVIVQRCWLHKLRNLKKYVPEKNHSELLRRMKKLMNIPKLQDALADLSVFIQWLASVSLEAESSMREVGKELLTVHSLGLPKELRDSLSTTNAIESLIGVVREKTGRVKNWKSKKGFHISRWVASSIRDHKSKMRRLKGFKQAQLLVAALGTLETQAMIA